jgi:hypothetical protein
MEMPALLRVWIAHRRAAGRSLENLQDRFFTAQPTVAPHPGPSAGFRNGIHSSWMARRPSTFPQGQRSDILILMNQNDIYLDKLKMVFQLSKFLIELKLKYYRKIFPEKSGDEVTRMVYQELVDYKEKELKNAARQYIKRNI